MYYLFIYFFKVILYLYISTDGEKKFAIKFFSPISPSPNSTSCSKNITAVMISCSDCTVEAKIV